MNVLGLPLIALFALVMFCAPGCSTWKLSKLTGRDRDVHPKLEERQQAAVADYERRRTEAELQAAQTRIEQGDLAGGRVMLASVLKRHPENRQALLLQAEMQLAAADANGAENTLRGVLQRNPHDGDAHQALALLLDTTGRSDEAQRHFAQASRNAAQSPNVVPATHQSTSNVESGQSDQRLKVVQSARSAHAQKLLQQAVQAVEAGSAETGLSAVKSAMDAERQSVEIPLAFSVLLMKHGRPHDAVMLLTYAKTRFADRADIHRALGAAHLLAGDLDEAQVVLQTAVSLDSAHPLSYFLLGQVLQERGDAERAAEMVRQAHRIDSRYPQQL